MKTILVVDDDDSLRKVIAASLTQRGYRVLEASDGMDGLSLAGEHKPDLILSDVYMDNMNGFMMAEQLRDDEETSWIPIILMTSAAQAAGAWKAYETVQYLDKGFTMDTLVKMIKGIVKE